VTDCTVNFAMSSTGTEPTNSLGLTLVWNLFGNHDSRIYLSHFLLEYLGLNGFEAALIGYLALTATYCHLFIFLFRVNLMIRLYHKASMPH
jgi:hypothetical protein